jgi:protein-tyrosine phosphatase
MTSIRWLIGDRLGKSDLPSEDDLLQWKEMGIHSIVNLVGERWGTETAVVERKMGFRVLHERIPDFCPPSLAQLAGIISWIEDELKSGHTVVVHCLGGIGRTGTVLAAYLVNQGYSLEGALSEIAKIGSFPQTPEQHGVISEYMEGVGQGHP